MQFFFFADILPPTLTIAVEGSPVAGNVLTMLCRVILPDGLTTEPQIAWLSPEGNVLMSEGELTVGNQPAIGNPSRLITFMIQFSPLLTSHGGNYTCRAIVNSPHGTIQQSVSMAQNVSIASKY